MNLLERIASSSGRLLLEDSSCTYSALARDALRDAELFHSSGKAMLWTDKVDRIIAVMAAAQARSVDLYIAHRTIRIDEVRALAARFGIGWLIDGDQVQILRDPSSSGSGSVFIMTSGTTRAPKVALHTPENLFATQRRTEKSEHARWLLTYPATSFAGLQVIFSAVLGGADLVVPRAKTIPAFAEAAEQRQVTHVSGTPTFWRSFLLVVKQTHAAALKQVTIGGEAVDQVTLDRLGAAFPHAHITHIYASTEAGVGFSVNDRRAGIPAEWLQTGVGEVRLRVQNGVLEIKSPRMLKRYESGEETPIDAEGWLSTGDLIKAEGDRLLFVGRADRRLNVGGFKVSPEEVEAVLMESEGVADVQVTGVSSPISGQVLAASVVPKPGRNADTVKKAVQRRAYERLEPYKVPRIVRVVQSIAAADSGKKTR